MILTLDQIPAPLESGFVFSLIVTQNVPLKYLNLDALIAKLIRHYDEASKLGLGLNVKVSCFSIIFH